MRLYQKYKKLKQNYIKLKQIKTKIQVLCTHCFFGFLSGSQGQLRKPENDGYMYISYL